MNDNSIKIDQVPLFPLKYSYFEKLDKDMQKQIISNYNYLKKFNKEDIVTIINNYFFEEDKVNILRNKEFINNIDSYYLETILNNMKFISVFNMLQNEELLNKIDNISLNIKDIDSILAKGYLESINLINKTSSSMITNLINMLNKKETKEILNKEYIINKLNINDLIDIVINKKINLNEVYDIDLIDDDKIKYYIDQYLNNTLNIDIINNKKIVKKVFKLDNEILNKINFEEVKYLFETINSKSNITIQETNYSIMSYQKILASYLLFGINKTKEIMNKGNNELSINKAKEIIDYITKNKLDKYKIDNENTFDNLFNKVINELDNNNNYVNNIILKNIISIAKIYGYINIINIFDKYLEEKKNNENNAKKRLYNYIKRLLNTIYETEETIYYNDTKKKVLESFEIKESIKYNYYKKDYNLKLKRFKVDILVKTIKNKNPLLFQDYYKYNTDVLKIKEIYINKLGKETNINDVINYVLIPYINNNLNIISTLDELGIEKPSSIKRVNNIEEIDKEKNYNNDLKRYIKYVNLIEDIIKKTNYFTNYYIDSNKVKLSYNKYFKKDHEFEFNGYNYKVKKRIYGINDFIKLFSGINLNKIPNNKDLLFEYFKNNNIIVGICENYYNDLIPNLGFLISNFDKIVNYTKDNNINILNLNIVKIQDILFNKIIKLNPIGKKISNNTLDYLIKNNYDLDKAIDTYTYLLQKQDIEIPYISSTIDNISYELMDYQNDEILKYYDYKNSYYFKFKNIKDNKIIDILKGNRYGNCFVFDNINNDLYIQIKNLINNLILETTYNKEAINFILTKDLNYSNGIIINGKLLNLDDNDYLLIGSNKHIKKENNNKEIKKTYPRKRNNYKVIGKLADKDDINNVNAILYIWCLNNKLDYNNLNINYDEIIYGDDFVIVIDINNNISVYNISNTLDNNDEINYIVNSIKSKRLIKIA